VLEGRLFNCNRCNTIVIACGRCDRGRLYCSESCSEAARRDSLHRACARYQATAVGREKHRLRQKRYRQALALRFRTSEINPRAITDSDVKLGCEDVTHQCSLHQDTCSKVESWKPQRPCCAPQPPGRGPFSANDHGRVCCSFCGASIPGGFLRLDFRRRR
jgi:hypothetical protein